MSSDQSTAEGVLVSADSHVIELPSVWEGILPPEFFGKSLDHWERGIDPSRRGDEMRQDGVAAEVLYPTLGLKLFAIEDVEQHEEGCRAYNNWLIEYCNMDPDRLIGIAAIPCYRPEVAVAELRRCRAAGMRGAMVWQAPHPDLPFTSFHYDPIWKVAEELDMPINVHILTGFNYTSRPTWNLGRSQEVGEGDDGRLRRISHYQGSVNEKLACTISQLFSFLFSGVFERFPGLKLVIVENECSWLPFLVDQWDYYYHRFLDVDPTDMAKPPSEYINDQVRVTFFRDPWVGRFLERWGEKVFMWSNDFPHGNSTWPKSREYTSNQLAGIDPAIQEMVLRKNCIDLYSLRSELILPGV
jgi:predicted TIM-barrel fold metal-dependent hydrolase